MTRLTETRSFITDSSFLEEKKHQRKNSETPFQNMEQCRMCGSLKIGKMARTRVFYHDFSLPHEFTFQKLCSSIYFWFSKSCLRAVLVHFLSWKCETSVLKKDIHLLIFSTLIFCTSYVWSFCFCTHLIQHYCHDLVPGITYVTFTKTSEAALAQEEMNGRVLPGHPKPLKVCALQSYFHLY